MHEGVQTFTYNLPEPQVCPKRDGELRCCGHLAAPDWQMPGTPGAMPIVVRRFRCCWCREELLVYLNVHDDGGHGPGAVFVMPSPLVQEPPGLIIPVNGGSQHLQ